MKILIYSDYYKKKSGYAREIADLLPYFKAAGHEIAHVALGYTGYPLHDDPEIRVYPTDVVVESNGRSKGVSSYFAPEILDFAIDDFKPDVVFTRQDYFCLKEIGLVLARPRGFKWVHWGLADGEPLGKNTEEPLKWIHEHIFTTEFTKRVVQAEQPEIDGDVIMPPINPKTWDVFSGEEKKNVEQSRAERRKKKGVTGFDTYIACVARNQRRKNLPVLFEAIKILRDNFGIDALLMLVAHQTKTPGGNFAGWDLDHLVKYFGVEQNVYVAGRTDGKILHDEAVAEIYAMSDMFALPTMGEGFGLIFGEAMYAKLPIITTDYSACTEVVKTRGVLVKPKAFVWDTDNAQEAIVDANDFAQGIADVYHATSSQLQAWQHNQIGFLRQQEPQFVAQSLLAVMERSIGDDVECLALKDKAMKEVRDIVKDKANGNNN